VFVDKFLDGEKIFGVCVEVFEDAGFAEYLCWLFKGHSST